MNQQPNYYANIPANVRYSKVTANAKLLYGEITALTNKEGYCWASNQYFADLYDVHSKTVSAWVSELVKEGFIRITVHNKNERKIYLAGVERNHGGGGVKSRRGVERNHGHNNTVITTDTSETDVSQEPIVVVPDTPKEKRPKAPQTSKQVFDIFKEVTGKAPRNWTLNKTQRQAAENLFDERGLDQIRKALEGYQEVKNEPFCPTINSPYDLDSKWSNLYQFIQKHS